MPRAFHPAFGDVVQYSSMALPQDPDGQVRETIREVIRWVRADSHQPAVEALAERVRLDWGQGDPILGVWRFIKERMRFQHDEDTAQQIQADDPDLDDAIEVLIRPIDQIRLIFERGTGIGDCDCFELLAACLLHTLDVRSSLVTVAADPDEPTRFSHVYLAVYRDGQRIPLDFSHGPYPGWECPNLRLKEWSVQADVAERTQGLLAAAVITAFYLWLRRKDRRV